MAFGALRDWVWLASRGADWGEAGQRLARRCSSLSAVQPQALFLPDPDLISRRRQLSTIRQRQLEPMLLCWQSRAAVALAGANGPRRPG